MKQKNIAMVIPLIIIICAGAFYGGTAYEKNKLSSARQLRGMNNGTFSAENRGQRPNGQGRTDNPNGGDFISGQITAKDDKSIIVKTNNGSSKIVFFSDSTTIGKAVEGSSSDLTTGQQIMANGKNSPDGNMAAQNIQIKSR